MHCGSLGFRLNGGVCVIDINQEKLILSYQVKGFLMNVGCFPADVFSQ